MYVSTPLPLLVPSLALLGWTLLLPPPPPLCARCVARRATRPPPGCSPWHTSRRVVRPPATATNACAARARPYTCACGRSLARECAAAAAASAVRARARAGKHAGAAPRAARRVALPSALLRLLPGTYTGMPRTRRAAAALALALALALSWMGSGVRGDDLDEVCSADDRRSQYVPTSKLVWVVVLAAFVAMAMGFGIGANDSANSWGTSVGSGAIPVRYAVLLGGGMEFLGATSLGYGVSGTIQKGVSDLEDPDCWACGSCNSLMSVYMTAMFAALIGGASFLGLATFTAMPVSTTHAIVGGVVGATIACTGFGCLNWSFDGGLGGIVASWVISPLLSGAVGVGLFVLTQRTIIKTVDPRRNALRALPILVASTAFVMLSLILLKAKVAKDMAEVSPPELRGAAGRARASRPSS
eukprot:scaffold275_cov301-Prasinococcus_capsulatus_cf.AAC.4